MATDSVPSSEIPQYLKNASPVPIEKRAPWYMNTAPTYAGIFLWFAFYQDLGGSLRLGSLLSVLIGVVMAGLICHFFFYYVPGMLGMKTGLQLYIVGTSTFGTKGGYFIPGILMGLLQIGWYSVATFFATKLVLVGLGLSESGPLFYVLAIIWGLLFALIGALGIGYVAKISQFFTVVPILMLLIGVFQAVRYLGDYQVPTPLPGETAEATDIISIGSMLVIQMIVGFFGTAGAVGADFCANNRNKEDVQYAGLTGIWLATVFAAGLAIITVAGAHGENKSLTNVPILNTEDQNKKWTDLKPEQQEAYRKQWAALKPEEQKKAWDELKPEQRSAILAERKTNFEYGTSLASLNTNHETKERNWLAGSMLLLFAIGSMAPACFCSFIIGNSLSTMLGKPGSRIPITLGGAAIGIAIALTGAPANLAPIFGLVGASFGPVIGAMIADYFLNGAKWPGPREGVNVPGYLAWGVGFLVGISNNEIVTQILGGHQLVPAWHPTGVYSLVVGFVVYIVAARFMGLPPRLEGVVKTVSGQE